MVCIGDGGLKPVHKEDKTMSCRTLPKVKSVFVRPHVKVQNGQVKLISPYRRARPTPRNPWCK